MCITSWNLGFSFICVILNVFYMCDIKCISPCESQAWAFQAPCSMYNWELVEILCYSLHSWHQSFCEAFIIPKTREMRNVKYPTKFSFFEHCNSATENQLLKSLGLGLYFPKILIGWEMEKNTCWASFIARSCARCFSKYHLIIITST